MAKVQKKLQNYLVLNRYLTSLFGFSDMEDFRKELKDKPEGLNQNKKFYFTEILQNCDVDDGIRQKLNEYDENIQEYLNHINQNRDPPIVLKYFQYIAVLLTEIFLDKYYNEFDVFYSDFTKFVLELNKRENKTGVYSYPYPNKDALNKLAFWSATGSGKTLIMHINMLQAVKYNTKDYDNLLLITPNEGLSSQHIDELKLSGIEHKTFETQKTLDDWSLENPVKVIEITKIKKEATSQGGKTVPVEAFGDNNIIFVDEGHKGHSTEAKTWKSNRQELVGNKGFTFEYSATFGEITDKDETFNEYASAIIFDYRYKYFYEDGYGKDYHILNLKNKKDYGDEYFTGAILSLYEQKLYYRNYGRQIKQFNIENPLMIFVGSSVSGKKNDSDVLQVVEFLAKFVNDKDRFRTHVRNILTDKSSLSDVDGQRLFSAKFPYLRRLIQNGTKNLDSLYEDILQVLFHVKTSKTLQFIELKNAEGEIGLRFDDEYFGVINIGDVTTFLKLVDKEEHASYFQVGQKSHFEQSLFKKIERKNSPINFLIGSKKFIEGWNSYRVSAMGLLNIGKKEGAQIIQLFGRGVRLRGYDNLLKRSYALEYENQIPADVKTPSNLNILETLNIFGLNANYMATFKETLREEGIEEYEKIILKIKPTLPTTALYVPRKSDSSKDFISSVQITSFDQAINKVRIDLSAKIDILESKQEFKQIDSQSPLQDNIIDEEILELLDYEKIYLELLKYKDLKKYYNLYFTVDTIKQILHLENYIIFCKKEMLQLNEHEELIKINKIQDYVVQLLKSYIDKVFKYEKFHWYQKNLQYDPILQEDKALIPKEYIFTINANAKTLIKDIRDFTNRLSTFIRINSEDKDTLFEQDMKFTYGINNVLDFFATSIHLFKPLIYKSTSKELEFIKISPVNLVESERIFIKQLDQYLKDKEFNEIYLLRNPSRKGIGFFETKNFYPDFILWILKEEQQIINFIEPHGLVMTEYGDEKLQLYKDIKTIQQELQEKTKNNIVLNSFILSKTNYKDLPWSIPKQELIKQNILFLEDGDEFLNQMFKIIDNSSQ